jgi:hypothetical protein
VGGPQTHSLPWLHCETWNVTQTVESSDSTPPRVQPAVGVTPDLAAVPSLVPRVQVLREGVGAPVSLSPVLLQDSYRTDPLPGLGACGRADRWCPGPGGGAGRGRPLQPGTPSHPQRPFRGSVRPGSGRTSPPPVSARFLREPPPVPRLTKAGRARPAVTCCQVLSKKVAASAAKAGVSPLLPPPTRYLLVGAGFPGAEGAVRAGAGRRGRSFAELRTARPLLCPAPPRPFPGKPVTLPAPPLPGSAALRSPLRPLRGGLGVPGGPQDAARGVLEGQRRGEGRGVLPGPGEVRGPRESCRREASP